MQLTPFVSSWTELCLRDCVVEEHQKAYSTALQDEQIATVVSTLQKYGITHKHRILHSIQTLKQLNVHSVDIEETCQLLETMMQNYRTILINDAHTRFASMARQSISSDVHAAFFASLTFSSITNNDIYNECVVEKFSHTMTAWQRLLPVLKRGVSNKRKRQHDELPSRIKMGSIFEQLLNECRRADKDQSDKHELIIDYLMIRSHVDPEMSSAIHLFEQQVQTITGILHTSQFDPVVEQAPLSTTLRQWIDQMQTRLAVQESKDFNDMLEIEEKQCMSTMAQIRTSASVSSSALTIQLANDPDTELSAADNRVQWIRMAKHFFSSHVAREVALQVSSHKPTVLSQT